MIRLPDDVREEALAHVYAEFDRLKWEQVPPGERGAVYVELIADESFSRLLAPYFDTAQMRVWLKDSAAKEYPRALEGIGPAASHTKRGYPGPSVIVSATLGLDWSVVTDSIEQKPMRCQVMSAAGEAAVLIWGPQRMLSNLHWAASVARVAGEQRVVVAVTRHTMAKPAASEWVRVQALCDLIGVEAHSVMYMPRTIDAVGN
ncbi:hypothetical protein [Gordonia lacunae]|uniref:hypothetical protein n=1 Tax=Gordonia lacunae TaxID=417102 RepID=UPI00118212CC|nr:hypothetical protein [Gordonia lacunae]